MLRYRYSPSKQHYLIHGGYCNIQHPDKQFYYHMSDSGEVKKSSLNNLARQGLLLEKVELPSLNALPAAVVVARARQLLGNRWYSKSAFNCESFAMYCKYDVLESWQIVVYELLFSSLCIALFTILCLVYVARCIRPSEGSSHAFAESVRHGRDRSEHWQVLWYTRFVIYSGIPFFLFNRFIEANRGALLFGRLVPSFAFKRLENLFLCCMMLSFLWLSPVLCSVIAATLIRAIYMVASEGSVQLLYALILSVSFYLTNAIVINRSHWSSPSVRVWLDGIVTDDKPLLPAQRLFCWESTASFCAYFLSLHIFPFLGMLFSILSTAGMMGQLCSLILVLTMALSLFLQLTSPSDGWRPNAYLVALTVSNVDAEWMLDG